MRDGRVRRGGHRADHCTSGLVRDLHPRAHVGVRGVVHRSLFRGSRGSPARARALGHCARARAAVKFARPFVPSLEARRLLDVLFDTRVAEWPSGKPARVTEDDILERRPDD
jgi:hypothetical protein